MLFILRYLILFATLVAAKGCNLADNSTCPSGAHIIVARGSLEPQGSGLMGAVAQQIRARISDSDISPLKYPAIYEPYMPSQTEGVRTLAKVVRDYATLCPKTKMILLGYSQGAHVIADVMCGASSIGFPATKPLSLNISSKIAAVVLMGDPSTTKGQEFHVGSSEGDGVLPRQNPDGCRCVSGKTISFCDAGDPFCEAGGHDLRTHMRYVSAYGQMAADFAVSMFHLS
ncbi:cutinase [Fusarium flagelliforme]|uniref:cutinase n=1 Tax=Fusarium flagelliforme TaxID=2675880 RepID=UPI001E8EC999|nr:cutinase [Fusarium flagelliforme]KAH7196632.1 cutinase [Fusarium flagelliforme]